MAEVQKIKEKKELVKFSEEKLEKKVSDMVQIYVILSWCKIRI